MFEHWHWKHHIGIFNASCLSIYFQRYQTFKYIHYISPFMCLSSTWIFCFDAVEVPFPHWVHHLPASSNPYSWTHGSSDEKRSLVNRALRTMTKTLGEFSATTKCRCRRFFNWGKSSFKPEFLTPQRKWIQGFQEVKVSFQRMDVGFYMVG